MTQARPLRDPSRLDATRQPRGWPLTAAAAGLSGLVATLVLDGRGTGSDGVSRTPWLFEDLDPAVHRASMVVGYLAVVLLLVTAAHWRRRVETRVPGSTAAHLVPLGLAASAAGLTYGFGSMGTLGGSLPGGLEHGSSIGWLGVVAAAGAVAWMAFRERTVSLWLGVVSVLPVLQTALMVVGTGVPGVAALLAPLWLVVAGVGLAVGRSTIVR